MNAHRCVTCARGNPKNRFPCYKQSTNIKVKATGKLVCQHNRGQIESTET